MPLRRISVVNPQQVDEQPSAIAVTGEPGADCAIVVAHEQAEIVVAAVGHERRVERAELLVDELAVVPIRVLLDAEPAPGRQLHGISSARGAVWRQSGR
jgi:hypothetical protein